ncbi:putative quinol monooxygenase [Rossellomorea aquimaris]|uniref:putative quinol monooxygenase n=1 Tax=Rossellomorea aquimaris TaxID=189382 RepID=UPI0005CB36C7|nr:putative quinol monooxygenase [Rossellomorea aquimaris]
MSPITITAILTAKPGREEQLYQELIQVITPSRREKGCIEYSLHQSLGNKGTFVFYETWGSEEALASHTDSEHYNRYRKNTETLVEKREVYRLQKVDL